MKSLRRLSLAEQTAEYLRERLLSGYWGGKLPGVNPLCAELQVSQATVRAAFRQL
jgi:DNA-binding GntR family transcriptional regulator